MLSLRLVKASSVASDKDVSFLSKTIDIGCEELGKFLVLLTAASDGDPCCGESTDISWSKVSLDVSSCFELQTRFFSTAIMPAVQPIALSSL